MNVLTVFGTRPEAIKMAPVIRELHKRSRVDTLNVPRSNVQRVTVKICVTAQHRQMLDQVLELFAIKPDIDLDLMEDNQSPASLTARAMTALTEVLEQVRPDLVLVQGDTTTAMVAALAAFYQKIPVGHIEAGLRTRNRYSPFPEEINRHLIGVLATYHFAPTRTAADALRAEGVPEDAIFITGNTVIDALLWIVSQPPSQETCALLDRLLNAERKIRNPQSEIRNILVTAHRRENFGQPLENICIALREIVRRNPDVQVVYPVHMNPNVREPVYRILNGHERLHLIEPLPYEPFAHLMKHAYLVLTDSGGIQEEAPALGKPVLVMRRETERPEAVEAGTVKIVGTDSERIIAETERLLYDADEYRRMAHAVSPYGDGHAAERIVAALLGEAVEPWRAEGGSRRTEGGGRM
jgi:UDP-N-acetylglucosamine 2-epimerase (non-hydrolysing)